MTKRFAALLSVFLLVPGSFAADSPPTAEQLKSAAWWLDRAVKFADRVPAGEDRSEAHYQLTYALANAGDFGRAMLAAEQVSEPQFRIYAFCYVAKKAHSADDESTCAEALKVAREVATEAEIGQTNAHLVRLFFELGHIEQALPFADSLPNQTQRFNAISNLAEEHGKLGAVEKAMELVRTHLPPNWLDARRATVVHGLAAGKHFDKALALVEKVQEPRARDNAYDRIADQLTLAGKTEEAKGATEKIADQRIRDVRRAQIAKATVGTESVAAAFSKATTREEKLSLGMLLIVELIKAEKAVEAEALIESLVKTIEDSPAEPQVSKFGTFDDAQIIATIKAHYLETALLLKNAGDEAAAQQRIEKAIAATKAVKSQSLGTMMLHQKMVHALNALGETAAAEELLALHDTPLTKATSAGDIAATLILQGKVAEGLKLAKESVADRSMASGTRRVAIALLTVKRFDELANYMAEMPDSKQEVRAFREIAQELVKTGSAEKLNDLIDKLPSDAARTQACLGAHDRLIAK